MSDPGDDEIGSPLEDENYSNVVHSGEVTLKSFYVDPSLPQEKLDPFSSLEDEIESLYAVNFAKKKISENTEMDLFQGCYISEEVCSQLRKILTASEVYRNLFVRRTHAEECEHMRSFDHNSIMELASVKTSIPTKVLQRAKARLQKLYTLPRIRRDEVASQLGILIDLLQMNPPILIDYIADHHIPENELRLDSQTLSAEFSNLERRQSPQGEDLTTRLLRQRFLRSDYKNTDFRHPATTSELCILMNDSIITIPPALLSVFDGSVKLLADTLQRLSLPGNIQGYDRIKADEVGVITVSDIYRPINDITDFVSPMDYLPPSVTSLVPPAPADLVARLNKDVPLPRHKFNDDILQCYWCLSTQPQWRPGPKNVRLCNSCGLRYASTVKRDLETELRNLRRLKNWVEELEKNRRDMGAGRPRTEAQKKSLMRRRPWNVVDNLVTAYAMLNVESDQFPASYPFYDPSLFRVIPRDLLADNKDSTSSRPGAANLNDITSDTFSISSPSTLSSPSSSTAVPAMSSGRLPNACEWCGTVYSRTWRKGPTGERSLCGGCGLVYENRVLNANADSRKRKRDRDRQGEDEEEENLDTDSSALDGTEGSSDESRSEVESIETRSSLGKPFRKRLKYLSKEIIDDSDEDM
ncbi:hypothetical protein BKA69DRAFT_733705 [Paraphysoderma sedebokerense]|nr:hypothetical protein BKA69DRAFT_733705 [Paraphysoderma sedebokerense]